MAEQVKTEKQTAAFSENESKKTAAVKEKPLDLKNKSLSSLGVNELDNIINVLEDQNRLGKLNVSQQKLLEDAQKKRSEKDVDLTTHDGDDPNKKDPESKGPFKEEDIIKYMYNDWLLGGANWLWEKTECKIQASYYWAQRTINKIRHEKMQKRMEREGKKFSTADRHKKFEENINKSNDDSLKKYETHQSSFQSQLDQIEQGNALDTKAPPAVKLLLDAMDEKERKAFAQFAGQRLDNLYNNLKNAEIFAGNMAKAGMVLDLVKDPKGGVDKTDAQRKQEYEQRKQKLIILFARAVDNAVKEGKNPQKVIQEMISKSNEVAKLADNNVFDLKCAENGKDPDKKSMKKYNDLASSLQQYNTHEAAKDMGLYERAVRDQSYDRLANRNMEQAAQAQLVLMARRENNEDRKAKLNELKIRLHITPGKEEELYNTAKNTKSQIFKKDSNRQMAEMLGGLDR